MECRKNYTVERTYEQFYTGGKVKVSDDGQYIFTNCESTVKVTELSTLKTISTFEEEEDSLNTYAVGGAYLITSCRSLLLRQYDWKGGNKCARQWKGHTGPVMSMEFDPTATLLATGSSDGIIKVWDIGKQYCTHNFKDFSGVVTLLYFHPTKLLLFSSAASDCKIKAWDLQSSSCMHTFDGHTSAVTSLSVTANGKYLISGGRDKVINVWKVSKGQLHNTLPVYESVEGVVALPLTKFSVALAGDKGVISVWDVAMGNKIDSAPHLDTSIEYTDLLFCKKLNCLVGVASNHNILLYNIDNYTVTKNCVGYIDEILDLKCTDMFIVMANNGEQIRLYNRVTGHCDVLSGHTDTVMCVDVSVDGKLLVSGSKDNSIRLWRLLDDIYTCCAEGYGHTLSVGAVACARSTPSVCFVVSASQDRTVKLWNTQTVTREWNHMEDVVKLSVDCTQVAHDKDINSIDVSPNNKLIVTGSQDKTAKLWQANGLTLHGVLKGHRRGLWSVQFSNVDQCVLTSSADGTIKLWSIADMSCLKTFEGHNTSVLKAIFINRGMQFVSADNSGIIRIWNIKSQECVCVMDKHNDRIWALASFNDGEYVYSGGADSVLYQWKDVTKQVETEEQVKRESLIVREQDLMNYMHCKDYIKAVSIALSLNQPQRVLKLLKEMLDEEGIEGKFKTAVLSLVDDDRRVLLEHVCKWNTNSKHCRVAQSVLNVVLMTTPPEDLLGIDNISELLKGLIPYTERHFQRLSKLKQLASFVDYTWQCMRLSEDQD